MVTVRLTRLTPTQHRLEILRPNGARETVTLETRSTLKHDLLHFAVESEARLANSFYGRLAAGTPYAALAKPEAMRDGESLITERVVGPLTGFVQDADAAAEPVLAGLRAWFHASGDEPPSWLTPEFLVRVRERFRRLQGQWKATGFGEALELTFEV